MKRVFAVALCWISALLLVETRTTSITRIAEAGRVLEAVAAPGTAINEDILQNARCVGTFSWPAQAEFHLVRDRGKGIVVCRNRQGWSAPLLTNVAGGNPALHIVNGDTDVLMVAVSASAGRDLMQDRVVIRPRQGNTDILFYARSRGKWSLIDVTSITITPDNDGNRALYGPWVHTGDILSGKVPSPAIAEALYNGLAEFMDNDDFTAYGR